MLRYLLSAVVIAAALVAQAGCASEPRQMASADVHGRAISAQSYARERTSQDMALTMRQPSCRDNSTRSAVC